jgi:hypothetical protein
MKRLIYYPNFDVLDHNWLKFALLYIDKLQPIIPSSVINTDVWDSYNLKDETDLIDPLEIEINEGKRASREAIEIVGNILEQPQYYLSIFENKNYLDYWRDPRFQDYTLYAEKYSRDWELFVSDSNLGSPTNEGMKISTGLGYIYMAILANVLGDTHEISPITDQIKMDSFSILIKRAKADDKNAVLIAKRIVEISLPNELENVSIAQIIKFRNNPDFKDKISAFHKNIKDSIAADKNGDSIWTFFEQREGIVSSIAKELASIGIGVGLFTLGVWGLLDQTQHTNLDTGKDIALSAQSIQYFRNSWKNVKTKNYTNKYLADLVRIKDHY